MKRTSTHCDAQHEMTPENTKVDVNGSKRCRTCTREYRARRRKKAAIARFEASNAARRDASDAWLRSQR